MVRTIIETPFEIDIHRSRYVDMHTKIGVCPIRCAVCNKYIDDGERYSLLTCGNKLFPNVMVHDSHFGSDIENMNMIRCIMERY